MPAATTPTVHTLGEPVNGWNTDFKWDAPENALEKARLSAELDFMSRSSAICRELVTVIDKLDTVFGDVEANGYALRTNLPPFPLPGTLSSVKLEDVGMSLAVAEYIYKCFSESKTLDVYVEGVLVQIPMKPINVLRRLAKGGK